MFYQLLECQMREKVMNVNIVGSVDDQIKLDRLADELTDLCTEISSNGETCVIVLGGIGDNTFNVRSDLIKPISQGNVDPGMIFCSISKPIAGLDLPVIAAINGDAIGQGLELALACDMRISTGASHFGFPHIQKGFIPRDGGTQRLSRLVGRSKALEMILTGERIDAQEAYRIGLVNKIISSEDLMAIVIKMAQEMASKAPFSLKYAKEAIYKGMDLTLEQGLRLEADLYFLLHTMQDRTEGIQAFRGKRIPRFEGK
jgi:enoyl-CoA hydratase/carnithine racemase